MSCANRATGDARDRTGGCLHAASRPSRLMERTLALRVALETDRQPCGVIITNMNSGRDWLADSRPAHLFSPYIHNSVGLAW